MDNNQTKKVEVSAGEASRRPIQIWRPSWPGQPISLEDDFPLSFFSSRSEMPCGCSLPILPALVGNHRGPQPPIFNSFPCHLQNMTDSLTEPASDSSPQLKRRGSAKKMPRAKRVRHKSPGGKPSPTSAVESMEWEEQAKRLDPSDPVQANRIVKRRKMIQKGKNTVGYETYVQQVPKEKRVPRSMATPSTPDPTLDISTKRWQGQVRAWRVALHKYDPPELQQAMSPAEQEAPSFQTPAKSEASVSAAGESCSSSSPDSPLSILSESSRRDLNEEFEASLARPTLLSGTCNWADDSDDDEFL